MIRPADKILVRRSFDRAASTYDRAAQLQRQVCEALAARLDGAPQGPLLDAGCGTGYGARLLARRFPDQPLILADFAPAMLGLARQAQPTASNTAALQNPVGAPIGLPVCADVESLPLKSASLGLYWSSLTLQWCDLPRALGEAHRVLFPGGRLAVSTLGPGTFQELRQAFAGVDPHRHVLPFRDAPAGAAAALAAGFYGVRAERLQIRLHYPNLRQLLRAIKDVGANQVGGPRRPVLMGKAAWRTVEAAYERCRTPQGLPLSYDVVLLTGHK